MTAIVNNTCFSSNRGGNFQCFFSLILILTYFTPSQYEWQLLPPMWKGALNFVFFSFLLEANVAMQKQSTGCKWSTQKGGEVGSFPFFFGQVWGKKGVKNQNGNDICHQRWPALCQPLMRRSQRKPGRVRSELQICTVLALFKGGQAGQGMVPTHTLSVIQPPTTNTHPPHFPTNLSLPEQPQS